MKKKGNTYIEYFFFPGTRVICKRCHTQLTPGPNGYVPDHSVKDCNTQRSRLEESAGQHNVCSHHKKNEAPAILVGGICPVCSPNFKVLCIDPVHLHPSDNSTADNIFFFI